MINGSNSGNLIGVDPQLVALGDNGGPTNSMRPGATSPAIGAGSNSQAYAFDQRGSGFPRDAGGAVDIGAIQAFLAPMPPSIPVPALAPAALGALSLLLAVLGLRRREDRKRYTTLTTRSGSLSMCAVITSPRTTGPTFSGVPE